MRTDVHKRTCKPLRTGFMERVMCLLNISVPPLLRLAIFDGLCVCIADLSLSLSLSLSTCHNLHPSVRPSRHQFIYLTHTEMMLPAKGCRRDAHAAM